MLEVILDAIISVFRWDALTAFLAHLEPRIGQRDQKGTLKTNLGLFSIIRICFPFFYELDSIGIDLVEMVGGVGNLISVNVKKLKIFQDCFLKLSLMVICELVQLL